MQPATKHPSLIPAVAFSTGIAFASQWMVDWRAGFGAAFLTALGMRKWNWLLCAAWFFLGASLLSFRMDDRNANDLRRLFPGEAEIVVVRGVLDGDPEQRVLERDGRTRYRTTARIDVHEVERRGTWEPAVGEVAVSTTGFLASEFVSGASVQATGVLEKPGGPMAPGMFDFERYLKWQRIFFALRTEGTNDWKLMRQAEGWSGATLYRKFNAGAMSALQRGIPADENTRLLWAMTLGWKPGLTNDISEPFMRTGTLHIFAKSVYNSPTSCHHAP